MRGTHRRRTNTGPDRYVRGKQRERRDRNAQLLALILLLACSVVGGVYWMWQTTASASRRYTSGGSATRTPALRRHGSRSTSQTPVGERLPKLVRRLRPSVVMVRSRSGAHEGRAGTGFVVSDAQLVLTAHHVVDGATEVEVEVHTGEVVHAEVVRSDSAWDLALLALESTALPPVSLALGSPLEVGAEIVVVGFAMGASLGDEPTVTNGIVSALREGTGIPLPKAIQCSAQINPGNSGGPLVEAATGRVAGVVCAKMSEAEGIGFAVPLEEVVRILREWEVDPG